MHAVLGCRHSPEGRSIVLYSPLCILSNSGWLADEFIPFKEILDQVNRSAAKERPLGIYTAVHLNQERIK